MRYIMFTKNLNKLLLIGTFIILGESVAATNYNETGLRSMEDARDFKVVSLKTTLPDDYIEKMVKTTINYFSGIDRADQAVALLWKIDSLCGDTLATLRATVTSKLFELVNGIIPITERAPISFDIRFADVLWKSQFTGPNCTGDLKSPIDLCVVQKLGLLLSRRTEERAIQLKEQIIEKLKSNGYDLESYFY